MEISNNYSTAKVWNTSNKNVSKSSKKNKWKLTDSLKEKKDYMSMVKELMQLQYDSNNLPGYLSYKELYDYMNDKING